MSAKMAASQPWHFGLRRNTQIMLDISGKEIHLRYLHTWSGQPCLQSGTTHRWAPGESSHLPSGVPKYLSRDWEGYRTSFSRYYWGRLQVCWDSWSPHTRVLSHATLISLHWLPEALPCWTGDFTCLAAHLALEIIPCETLTAPFLTVLAPGPADWEAGLLSSSSLVWCHYWLFLISIVIRLVYIWIKSAIIKAEWTCA